MRDTDTPCRHLVCISEIDVLDEAESPDETGLVRLLSVVDCRIEFYLRQKPYDF